MKKLKTKPIPAIIMLTAGLIAAITTYINRYPVKDTLVIVFCSMVVFLILGGIIKMVLDRFEFPDEDTVDADGEMIEKAGEDGGTPQDAPASDSGKAEKEENDG